MRRASLLQLPYMLAEPLGSDVMSTIAFIAAHHDTIDDVRLAALQRLQRVATSLSERNREYVAAHSGTAYRHMRLDYHVLLMKWLQQQTQIEDRAVPDLLLQGMPIVGEGLTSPFFDADPSPADISLPHLLMDAPPRRAQLVRKAMSYRPQDIPALQAALDKTMQEVNRNCMEGPCTEEELNARFGFHWNPCRRFALQQGCSADGSPKYRVIDDHSENDNNKSAARTQRIRMAGVSNLMLMVKAMARRLADRDAPQPLSISSDDMSRAYRQVPVSDTNLSCCVVLLADPTANVVRYFILYAQPFGAAHAVGNFCRVAEWLTRVARRFFHLAVDHFYDDFFQVEPSATAAIAQR
eukprot:1009683-Amphidinium_carterae.1